MTLPVRINADGTLGLAYTRPLMPANETAPVVAIGDTFRRALDDGGAWEVTRDMGEGVWRLTRGREMMITTTDELLLRGGMWRRVRAL